MDENKVVVTTEFLSIFLCKMCILAAKEKDLTATKTKIFFQKGLDLVFFV